MDEADEAPVREPSARGRSRKPTKAQAALEKLRAAREKRESRAEQYEVESDDELFDVVPEEEYQALVRKRQAEDDFVVDDDGMGYVDNGEEYLDRMSDEEEAGAEAKGAKRSRAATAADEAMKKARKLNKLGALGGTGVQSASILKYMQTTGKAVGPGMAATARPKAAAEASLNLDDLLEDLASDPLGRAAGSGAPRRRSMGDVRPARGARLAFDSPPPVGGARRAAAASAPQQRRRAAKPEPQEYAAADDFDGGGGGYDYEGGSGGDKDFAAGAADDGAAAAGDAADAAADAVMADAVKPEEVAAAAPAAATAATGAEAAAAPAAPRSRFATLRATNDIKASAAVVKAKAAAATAAAAPAAAAAATAFVPSLDFSGPQYTFAAPEATPHDGAASSTPATPPPTEAATGQWQESDEQGPYMRMYWLDASEQQGTIYLFGKVQTNAGAAQGAPPQYASACVVVNGAETTLLVLPRLLREAGDGGDDDDLGAEGPRRPIMDVYKEIQGALVPRFVPRGFVLRCKPVKRKYAFGMTDVPRAETEYLKVWYAAKGTKPPSQDLCDRGGETFSRIVGGRTSLLENFLVKRKLMGPCWLIIRKPCVQADHVSWCKVEVAIGSPKDIAKMGSKQPNAPSTSSQEGGTPEKAAEPCAEARQPPPAPPLVTMSLATKTVINPSTQAHEAVAVAALVHTRVQQDAHSAETPDLMQSWVGVRPLGRAFAATGRYPGVLPHDMDATVRAANRGGGCGQVQAFADEGRLLQRVFSLLLHHDPDVIAGHNLLGFDLDVLLASAKRNGVRLTWSAVGRLRRSIFPSTFSGGGGGAHGRETFGAGLTAGRLVCDTYLSAKEFLRETTYSLTHLSASQLGARRNDVDPSDVPQVYLEGAPSILRLAQHTAYDSTLVQRLMLHLQVVPLTKQLTCLSGGLWSRTLRLGRAERVDYLLLHEFHERKFVTPEKPVYVGKSGGRVRAKAAYAGGLVLEPKRGLYDDYILLLDFNSLYPSIIQEYNLCFTTIDWTRYLDAPPAAAAASPSAAAGKGKKKKGKAAAKPAGGDDADAPAAMDVDNADDIMADDDGAEEDGAAAPATKPAEEGAKLPPVPEDAPPGVLPRVIKSLVERRALVKKMLKAEKEPGRRQELDIRQKALKLTANSMYGCLGFTHGRFCAQPIAALVTSKGREALQRTVDVTQTELGMEVVYGDTDSVMVNTRTKDLPQAKQQGNLIKREVNKLYSSLELDLDGIFQAMLLLKKKKYAALVVVENVDGTIGVQREVKGLDLVRRDWCGLSKEAGQHVLDRILSGDARETVVESIHEHLRALADAMRAGAVPIGQYVITKGLSKPPQDYPNAKNEPHLQVAMAMQRAGKPVNVGNHIPYIICRQVEAAAAASPQAKEEPQQATADGTADAVSADGEAAAPPAAAAAPLPPQTQTPAERARHPEDVMRSGGALVPDVEWYLAQQMVPPIARLCEPIEGTSAAIIAQQMGLDPARFSKAGGGGGGGNRDNDAEDWAFTPASLMSDEERFKDCMPLRARCAGCATVSAVPALLSWDATHGPPTAASDLRPSLACPSCSAPLWGHSNEVACFSALVQALVLAIRAAQARAAEGWYVCDDTCCGARTRDVGVRGSACPAPGCRQGRLSPEYSEKDLYEQLKSFEALFDLKRAQKRCHDRTKLPTGQLTVPKTHERVLELLLMKAKAEVDSSDYNWVKPTLWATVFGTTRAAHCA